MCLLHVGVMNSLFIFICAYFYHSTLFEKLAGHDYKLCIIYIAIHSFSLCAIFYTFLDFYVVQL